MPKYRFERLVNSKWSEERVIQAKNRKRAKEMAELNKKEEECGGTIKIRKIGD